MMDEVELRNRPTTELEVVGEVLLGENREGSTIINEEILAEGVHKLAGVYKLSNNQMLQLQHLHSNEEAEEGDRSGDTVLDMMITTIRSFFQRLVYPREPVIEEDELESVLTDDEVDRLAVFQGNSVDAFINELEESPETKSSEKHSQIKALFEDDNYTEWEQRCRQVMPNAILNSQSIKQIENYRGKLRAFLGSWSSSEDHCSSNIYLLDDQLTAHRIPVVNQSDSIRGKLGFSKGVHAWDIKLTGPLGTHCSVGIALKDAPLISTAGYVSMIGDDDSSWGWDLIWGNISHGGEVLGSFPMTQIYDYTPGDIIRLILDCDKGQLSYAVNEVGFGIAFQNLPPGFTWYPSVGLVYGNVEASLTYLGKPPPLRQDINANFDQ